MTDTAGTITDTYFYTAFGEELAKTGTTENEFRYVGEQWDPNAGFYYLRARWYDQSTGRFASVDPYDGCIECGLSQHRYLYAKMSPVSFFDPSGRISLPAVIATVIVIGITVHEGYKSYIKAPIECVNKCKKLKEVWVEQGKYYTEEVAKINDIVSEKHLNGEVSGSYESAVYSSALAVLNDVYKKVAIATDEAYFACSSNPVRNTWITVWKWYWSVRHKNIPDIESDLMDKAEKEARERIEDTAKNKLIEALKHIAGMD